MTRALLAMSFLAVGASGVLAQDLVRPVQSKPTDGMVWGALIVGTNAPSANQPHPFTEAEKPLLEKLSKAFGFSHFVKLGEHTQEISREYESWVVPSQELFLKIDSMGPVQNGLKLDMQLWQQQNVVVKTNCVLRAGSPVFIKGPIWGRDQLLMVVELRSTTPAPAAATAMNKP